MASTAHDINSPEYWEHRFKTDWQQLGGREQTEFFGRLALQLLPKWLVSDIEAHALSIADYGCGEGDAASLLKGRFPRSRVTGVDVSATAVRNAKDHIEGVEFLTGDVEAIPGKTDVVFCSNTLEHFHQPLEKLRPLLRQAGSFAILLVPFREFPREREHFFTFELDSFPAVLEGHSLVAWQAVDCRSMHGTRWLGDQLLVVYARPEALERAGVTLASLDDVRAKLRREVEALKREASRQQQRFTQLLRRSEARYRSELERARKREEALRSQVAEARLHIDAMTRGLNEFRSSRLYKAGRLLNKTRHPSIDDLPRTLRWATGAYRDQGIGLLGAVGAGDPLLGVQEGIERMRRALDESALPTRQEDQPSVDEQYHAVMENIRRNAALPCDSRRFAKERRELEARAETARGVVVYLPTVNWGYLFQRPHQLVRELAKRGYLCVFCPAIPSEDGVEGLKEVEPNLFLCSDVRLTFGLPNTLLWVNWPINRAYQDHFAGARVVYEYIDELEVFHLYCGLMEDDHSWLVCTSDVVVATADRLRDQLLPERSDVVLAPNGVDPADFRPESPLPVPADLAPILTRGRPIVGYYGALAKWFDYELLNAVTALAPDISFVLIGPDYDGSASEIVPRENVFVLGQKPYQELAAYSTRFDVATVPFKINEITRSTSPVKLFEYMAAGAAIVTTPMDECRKYRSVKCAGTPEEFVAALREAIALRNDPGYRSLLSQEADENSWAKRVDVILEQLARAEVSRRLP